MNLLKSLKLVTLLAAATASLPVPSLQAAASLAFTDTKGHWAESDIQLALSKGYVDGYQDATFKPDSSITRAEFVKMLVTGLVFQVDPAKNEYWHSKYVLAAQANGLLVSAEAGSDAELGRNIVRGEMAKLAVRGTGATTNEANKWMYLATSKGIITGLNESGELGLDQPTTRAQAITVIERILKIRGGAKLPADKYATSEAEIYWHRTNIYSMAPEYFGWGKKHISYQKNGEAFPWEKVRYESALGMSEVEKFIIIDLDDPRDPNKKFLQDNMRWNKKVGRTHTPVADLPANAYVFLSFNHVIRYDTAKSSGMYVSDLGLNPFDNGNYDNVDSEGNLINIALYAPYVSNGYRLQYQGSSTHFEEGQTEVRYISGTLAPKNPLITDDRSTSIYKAEALSFGEKSGYFIYDSEFDASLGGGQR